MGILLNSKERLKIIGESRIGKGVDNVMKAQAIKVLNELDKPCQYTYTSAGHAVEYRLKKYCPYCMTEIRKENI